MSKVYVTQQKKNFDYSEAMQFGEVVFLSKDEYLPLPVRGGTNHDIIDEITEKLEDYRPGVDCLLLSGSPVSMFIMGMLAAETIGSHRVLKWNGYKKQYDECVVP